MVAPLKKKKSGDIAGRFTAWWDGRDYRPEKVGAESNVTALPEPKLSKTPARAAPKPVSSASQSRVAALETIWGEGRFSPWNSALYSRLTEGMRAPKSGTDSLFGVVNGDPALVNHMMGASGACPVVSEWRTPCLNRFAEQFPDFDVVRGDLDRPSFQPGSLDILISVDAFAYADHKSGLAVRAMRSLAPGGLWIALDLVRGQTTRSLAPAFASSWAEPQLCDAEEISEVCDAAGFQSSGDADDVSGDLMQACRSAFDRFGTNIEGALSERLANVNRPVFVRELAWEAESWKWRQRALAGDFLRAKVWRFRKPAG